MRKIVVLLILLTMLCGCGEKEEFVEAETTTQETETEVERIKLKEEIYSIGEGDLHIYTEVDKEGKSYITFSYMTDVKYEAAYAYVLLESL